MTTDQKVIDPANALRLFNEHEALFLNKPEDFDVFPRLVKGVDEAKLQVLVDDFYAWVSMYDLTRQWLVEEGEFQYDFDWLTSKFSNDEVKRRVDENFKLSTGVYPDEFEIRPTADRLPGLLFGSVSEPKTTKNRAITNWFQS